MPKFETIEELSEGVDRLAFELLSKEHTEVLEAVRDWRAAGNNAVLICRLAVRATEHMDRHPELWK